MLKGSGTNQTYLPSCHLASSMLCSVGIGSLLVLSHNLEWNLRSPRILLGSLYPHLPTPLHLPFATSGLSLFLTDNFRCYCLFCGSLQFNFMPHSSHLLNLPLPKSQEAGMGKMRNSRRMSGYTRQLQKTPAQGHGFRYQRVFVSHRQDGRITGKR